MTRDQAIAYIQQGMGFRADLSTEILLQLDLQQRELEKGASLPQWLITEAETLNGVASDGTLTLPASFIREADDANYDSPLRYTTSDGVVVFLAKRSAQQVRDLFADPTTGVIEADDPIIYALLKTTIEVAPVPSATWHVTLDYYGHDTLPSAIVAGGSGTNLWLTNSPLLLE